MRKSSFRLGHTIVIGNEPERIKSFGFWVDSGVLHHGSLRDGNPVSCRDMSPIGKCVRGQSPPLDRHLRLIVSVDQSMT